jgi:regulatory protein
MRKTADFEKPVPRAGRITALKPTKRDPRRISVMLDGSFAFTLSADLISARNLEPGVELAEEQAASLLAADDVDRATEQALTFLSYRPRSEREVRDRLRKGGYGQETIDLVVTRLYGWRYLDDADFARRWVENRGAQRPRGGRLLQQELRQKGIDPETAREVIAEADLDEDSAAEALARRRIAAYVGEDPVVVRRKVGAYLARRGYGFDVARAAMDRVLGESDVESGDDPIPIE